MSTKFNFNNYRVASLRTRSIRTASGMAGMGNFGFSGGTSGGTSGAYSSSGGGYGMSQNRYNPVFDDLSEGTIVEQFMPVDPRRLHRIWRRIYLQDPVAGAAIDLYKELPWSSFQLTGLEDKEIEEFYMDALNAINLVSWLPEISGEFLVMGKVIGHLHMDESKGYPTKLIIHNPDEIRVINTPLAGFQPKLNIIPTPEMKAWANSKDERDIDSQNQVDWLVQLIKSGKEIPLPAENSFYIPRKTSPYDTIGASIYTRIILFVAYEKALVNATIASAKRRMSNIRHITAGIDNVWTPTKEELDDISGMFMQADEDPTGAIVVTRTGVSASEVTGGTPRDMIKMSDEWQFLTSGKLNSLGVSESFISGDATYNSMEQLMSVFLEKIRAHRDFFVHNLIIDRLLKPLAIKHNFIKQKRANLDHRIRILGSKSSEEYILPTIAWQKSLRPIADRDYLEILGMMEEKGIPVTVSTWAASAGFDLSGEVGQFEDDLDQRKMLAEQRKKITEFAPEAQGQLGSPGQGGMGGLGGGMGGSLGGGLGDFGGGELGGLGGETGGTPEAGGEAGGTLELPTAASYKGASAIEITPADRDSIHTLINLPIWDKKGTFMGLERDRVELACRRLLAELGTSDAKAVGRDKLEPILKTGNVKRDAIQHYILGRAGILHGISISYDVAQDITKALCARITKKTDLADELMYVHAFSVTNPGKGSADNKNIDFGKLNGKNIGLDSKVTIPGDKTGKSLLTGFTG